jgi:hypothetical protein
MPAGDGRTWCVQGRTNILGKEGGMKEGRKEGTGCQKGRDFEQGERERD